MEILLQWARYFAAASVFFILPSYAEERIKFAPNEDVLVTIEVADEPSTENPGIKEVRYQITFNDKVHSGNIRVEALRDIRIGIDDYNFDGVKDFSINYFDDGWGVYEISRIFVFLPSIEKFNEVFPNGEGCPGEFISMRVDKKAQAIISSNYDGLEKGWYQCKSVLPNYSDLNSHQEANAENANQPHRADNLEKSQSASFDQDALKKIRSYLLENYFQQPENLSLVCFEIGQSKCPSEILRIKWDYIHGDYVGVSPCTSGNCDYFIFDKNNNYSFPVLETFGYRLTFNRQPNARLADITVMRRGDVATHQIIKYVYFSGAYHPKKCFEKTYIGDTKPKIKKVDCSVFEP